MVVGNMGTENKMNYTVMGSAVNLAARLEGVNRQYRTGIMINEYTKDQAGASARSSGSDIPPDKKVSAY
jgi:adenylate cyclase